ncbi:MAG: hypothetical protein QOF60_397 [Actinomycetota bacterium]|jgi:hypothetical protein|nr:hypothetical protein [Actinomycetota bacterium]
MAGALGVAWFLGACQSSKGTEEFATPTKQIAQIESTAVPPEILGLTVQREDQTATIARAERSYMDSIGLFSLRSGELLQATLQLSKFNDNADYRDAGFRDSLLAQIGGSRPKAVRMGDQTVYLTSGTKQRIFVWFHDSYLLILSTREEYPTPRTLLRAALEIRP